jgi:hypothetical protein
MLIDEQRSQGRVGGWRVDLLAAADYVPEIVPQDLQPAVGQYTQSLTVVGSLAASARRLAPSGLP